MKTLVTGATGLIGSALLPRLERAVILSREPDAARQKFPGAEAFGWAPEAGPPPGSAFEEVEAVVHLAGEPIAGGRWSEERKRRIRDSRVLGTRRLVEAMLALPRPPRVLVCASAIGVYGDRGEEELDEASAPGSGFLAEVCLEWEAEAQKAAGRGIRVVCIRNGIVLSAQGGALSRMVKPFRWGLGGPIGGGRQWMSWIHLEDEVGILLRALGDAGLSGPVNAVAPQPVTNAEFSRALGSALGRPAFLSLPRFALRAAFGEMSQVLTGSQRVLPRAMLHAGYAFRFPRIDEALLDLFKRV
ncbi:MAG: TIGR01777 family protein [Myxococcales bacterium]|nr:TIGR01777 family protein [Myxococcales bacterium]